ncbi:unnamed protein product [Candida verbasci]|uniref:Vacuolar protein sorting-associated protein 29 n=1 Tax=Candida verbasci TaxID=1227364 RepID=A0A9W4TU82_9ASCO|nr:unnamed protein product [Candida verbasci]
MLTLAISDLFIPERSIDLPPKFKKLLSPTNNIPSNNKIQNVICLGNIINSQTTLSWLSNISPTFKIVRGEYDDETLIKQQLDIKDVPIYGKFQHDNLKIGYTNGFQIVPKDDPLALSSFARELDVDILIWGGTHKVEAYTLDGKFFINPGSATGAFNFDWPEEEDEDEDAEDAQDEKDEKKEKKEETDDKEINKLYEIEESNTNIPSFCLLDTQGSTCTLYIYTYLQNEVKVDKITYTKS